MPGDKTHVTSAKWMTVMCAVVLFTIGWEIEHVLATAGLFMFCVMWLSPDLDYGVMQSKPMQRWGKLAIFWTPFEKYIDHRSRWSHGWILGFLTIQLNLVLIVAGVITFLRLFWRPLIEPLIAQANATIDDIIALNFSPEMTAVVGWWVCVCLAAHWHHKILDTFMRN